MALLLMRFKITVHGDRLTDKNSFLGGLRMQFTPELLQNTEAVWYPLSDIGSLEA